MEEKKEEENVVMLEDLQKNAEALVRKYEKMNKPDYFNMMMNGEFAKVTLKEVEKEEKEEGK